MRKYLIMLMMLVVSIAMHAEIKSGSCGTNVTYTLDTETGVMTIEGTGAMSGYSIEYYNGVNITTAPWGKYYQTLKSVTISEGVSNIGNSAFWGCTSLTSITIPNSVTNIGAYAFQYCPLTSITIPEGVTSIRESTFFYCSSLTSITIPKGVTSIGSSAFEYCSSLTSVTIPESVTSIGSSAFAYCSSLTSITIPEGVTSIGYEAFRQCSSLTSITIPSSVTSIGGSAFSGCSSLTSITIPSSVTSIEYGAFSGCSSLTSITIPGSVRSMGNEAFNGCYCLSTNVHNSTSFNLSDYGLTLCDVEQADGLVIKNHVAVCCRKWATSITIPSSVWDIEYAAFENCSSLTSITIPSSVKSIPLLAFSGCPSLTSITIPESVTNIGIEAFKDCSSLSSITIPSSVRSMGNEAFKGCYCLSTNVHNSTSFNLSDYGLTLCDVEQADGLMIKNNVAVCCRKWATSITIPGSVTSIGESAFNGCSSLTSVTCEATTVPTTGNSPFQNVNLSAATLNVPKSALAGYQSNSPWSEFGTILGFANSVASGNCGAEDDNLTWTLFDDGDLVIEGTGAMNDYSIRTAPWYTYRSNIKKIQITEGMTSIGSYAFQGCSTLNIITIPEGVQSIGDWAFDGCSSLTSTSIPSSVTDIGEYAFYECSSLSSITIPDGVKRIGTGAFDGCSLASISIPESVIYIGISPFTGCSSLVRINVAPNNTYYTSLDGVLFDKAITRIVQYPAAKQQASYAIPSGVTSIGYSAFWGCSSLTSITIPKGVTSIEHHAFNGCSSLASIAIPEGVTSIRNYAFLNCSSLTSITIPESVTSIGERAFYNCSSMTSINIPNGVTNIGAGAFSSCSRLPVVDNIRYADTYLVEVIDKTCTSANIKEGTRFIGSNAFENCSDLVNVTIPSSVINVGYCAFRRCTGLTSIEIPMGVTSLEEGAFSRCTNLTDVYIPSSVTNIGDYAFDYCSGLTSIIIPEGVANIGRNAFDSCSGLTDVTSLATTPPSISSSTFSTHGTLHVLPGCGDAYRAADYWSNFTIVEDAVDPNATYSLTFMVDDEQHHTASLKMGEEITLPEAPTKDGYTFKGWEGLPEDMLMPASDLTLVAVFEIILGDANGDNEIDVADLSAIASYILGHPGESFVERAADMNNDNEIDVADISALAYLILHPETAQKAKARKVAEKKENIENTDNTLYAEMLQAEAGTDVVLPIMMRNTIEATGFQLDLVLPEGVTLEEAALSNARTTSKRTNLFDYALQTDGTYRILCNSTKGLSINGHDGEVMILTLHIDKDAELGAQTIALKDMVLTDATGMLREESSLSESTLWIGNATGIHEMTGEKPATIYDLQGRKVNGARQKGLYIKNNKVIAK